MSLKPLALAATLAVATLITSDMAATAAPLPVSPFAAQVEDPLKIEVQGRRFGGRGPRVYVAPRVARPVVVRPVVRPAYVFRPRRPYVIGPGYRVARPWWRPGTAVAAGAALGFIAAASAVAWAGQPPAPGYCWYYTDPSYQAGFWDICPPPR